MATIIGIDLGKFKGVARSYDTATQEAAYATIPTDPDALRGMLDRARPDLVAFEACTVSGRLADTCRELGLEFLVADTMTEAWSWRKVKRKTDRDDAKKLARMAALGELPSVHVPSPEARQYREIVAYRDKLIGRRTAIRDRIRALLQGQGLAAPVGHRAWTEAGRAAIAAWARPLADCGPRELWRGELALELAALEALIEQIRCVDAKLVGHADGDSRVQLLRTIPGVGRCTAEVVVAALDDAGRFATAGQVSAYAGLVPKQFQSGATDRLGRITRRGPGLLRKVLVEAAWLMLRYNAWAAKLVARISRGQVTRRKQALVAVARKLLVRCWAMLRDGRPWDPRLAGCPPSP
ncbi:IS110 family RNA-guided transposase [Tautonia plasticadhaerens]|uniref:Transposase IS116/IS110/IS902 family protein n=1 Tax=Tautonia plasticadhaerens TaxID=2527974 RepID=A0A518H1W3_9BACT|nr:IS110 family transposase [Tautonia plasticadhaerens]QDV34813.1 Transposase IS116/IS110/IS902 family protein [Tautonia plasticadhaerens]